ncbi:hypothetical protein D3C85_1399770 [compost metagenome]
MLVLEDPFIAVQRVEHAQALMLVQRQRRMGHATPLQVRRGGAGHAVDLPDHLGDQLRIGQFMGDRNHHVVPFFQRIGITLRQGQFEHHIGVKLAVTGNQRCDQYPEAVHAVHPQPAAWLEMGAASLGGRLLHFFEYQPTAQQESLAGLGQAQAPCGALQKPGLHMLLQICDQTGHLRCG